MSRMMNVIVFILLFARLWAAAAGNEWTDAQLVPNETVIKAIHVNELRIMIDSKRLACGLQKNIWIDDPILPKQTVIKKIHFDQLRESILELREEVKKQSGQLSNATKFSYTDPVIEPKKTIIKAIHLSELRGVVETMDCLPLAPPAAPPVAANPDICPSWPPGVQTSCPPGLICDAKTKKCRCQPGAQVSRCRCGFPKDTGWRIGPKKNPDVLCKTPIAVYGYEDEDLILVDTTSPYKGFVEFTCTNGEVDFNRQRTNGANPKAECIE